MDDTKLEEFEKTYKKEKDYKIRIRMVTLHLVRVRNMSVSETADIQGHYRCLSSRKFTLQANRQMFSDVLTFFEHTDLLSTAPLPTLVFQQKGGQVHRNKIGERMLNTLSGILGSAPIGFPTRNNARMCSRRA